MDNNSKLRIFVNYYKENFIFKSDVYQPILISNPHWNGDSEIIKDNVGINIANKNKNYAELSGHYWVWKNFLPKCDTDYIGFCHYRRFLDFNFNTTERFPFKPVLADDFKKIFNQYTQESVLNVIGGFDIVLPYKYQIDTTIYDQFLKYHPKSDLDTALKVLAELYPDYTEDAIAFMKADEFYSCLNFVMKKELVNQYMEWLFNILFALEKQTSWHNYTQYMQVRMPAFIAERFFNIWLNHNLRTRSLKIIETTSFILVGDGYGLGEFNSPQNSILRYMTEFQLYNVKKFKKLLAQNQAKQ